MKIVDDTIYFNSKEPYFTKEKSGMKPNTIRVFDNMELLDFLQETTKGNIKKICITNSPGTGLRFERMLTDITEWQGMYIFSWEAI